MKSELAVYRAEIAKLGRAMLRDVAQGQIKFQDHLERTSSFAPKKVIIVHPPVTQSQSNNNVASRSGTQI